MRSVQRTEASPRQPEIDPIAQRRWNESVSNSIVLRGVRVHPLYNIRLEVPRRKRTGITGVSGSGKSSLGFDTLYAEGQRRYVEPSLRTRASSPIAWASRTWTMSRTSCPPSPSSERTQSKIAGEISLHKTCFFSSNAPSCSWFTPTRARLSAPFY